MKLEPVDAPSALRPRGRLVRETLLAAAFYLAVTVLTTWPQAIRMGDGLLDIWDAKLSGWILHWDFAQTLRDPANLFQAPILYPARYVLAFSENMYGAAVFGFPLQAAGATPVLNYNVNLLLAMFLSALAAWALARDWTGDPAASLAAGVIYAFLPYKIAQLPHLHMQWGAFLCLVFLFLQRTLASGRGRDAALLAVFFAWNVATCLQYAFFTGFLVIVVVALEFVWGPPERGRRIRRAVLAMAAGGLLSLPFVIPYFEASALYGMRRSIGEMTFFSAQPWYYLSAGPLNRLWGGLTARWRGAEGDFFPGLAALALAGFALARLPRSPEATASIAPVPVSRARRRAARGLDALAVVLVAVWIWSSLSPELRIGPLQVGDTGRVLVWLTIAVLARLAFAFPARSRYRSLADFLRRQPLDRRALLLLLLAATGILVSLGGHTPYYRFLFRSLGSAFRAIRAVARGVVLFQVALAVLAAWGLSLWTRNRPAPARALRVALVLAVLLFEYRAFPLPMYGYDDAPRPVDQWLRSADFGGSVIEMPFGFPYDCEYTLRQAAHGHPLVNGYSSFSPKSYDALRAALGRRPISDSVWEALRESGASVVVYHVIAKPAQAEATEAARYEEFLGRGLREGRLELLGSFRAAESASFAFRPASAAPFDARLPASASVPPAAKAEFDRFAAVSRAASAPPFGVVQVPGEGQNVAAGSWGYGWALDDSGIAEVRVGTELGPASLAGLGAAWPGLAEAYPDIAASAHGGFGFSVPVVPPGPHTLRVTFVANDGGQTTISRRIVVGPSVPEAGPK
ncbi:MAG TPA: hypothetical protein VGK26_00680 [Thermoanaerobaculia bacterium]